MNSKIMLKVFIILEMETVQLFTFYFIFCSFKINVRIKFISIPNVICGWMKTMSIQNIKKFTEKHNLKCELCEGIKINLLCERSP
jgi:hypothetical protein